MPVESITPHSFVLSTIRNEYCIYYHTFIFKKMFCFLPIIMLRIQKKAKDLVEGLELMPSEERLSIVGLPSQGDQESIQLPEEGKQWELLGSALHRLRWAGMAQSCHRRFIFHIRKHFCTMMMIRYWNRLPRDD